MRLDRDFFTRNTIIVARELLGKILVLKRDEKIYKGKIVETEAYIKTKDDAAHFHKGITDRTRVVAEEGGHIYIYNIYGMYQCFNIIAEKKGVHGGALIRGIEPIEGIEYMYENRYKKPLNQPKKREIINLTNGPAKFVMAYGINKDEFYGADLVTDDRIWVEDSPKLPREKIIKTTRINIDYAKSKDYLLRFYIKDNPFVSKK
ncbi:DNA-3-methyladenine glycosylase [Wansuia hejianensis]|uniref:Putative 3-methyladenine DNA glycosylase n=1 Tax=Wansuia hejianensis TaxID=2763667 RepID=A0A926EZ47_9FIRM|nr:DNA-3-methyladenine glycosylase [Wansuia hejianensis]MBC8591626.1 DNA-3-methyladenine glycosylase [Wansuia hejianensis]